MNYNLISDRNILFLHLFIGKDWSILNRFEIEQNLNVSFVLNEII